MREELIKLLGKEVIINTNFTYQLWNEKPTLFLAQDYRTVIDLYNSCSYNISIDDTNKDYPTINIWRYWYEAKNC